MPVYDIGSINQNLHDLSLDSKQSKSSETEDKVYIPRAEFDSILEIMETLSTKLKSGPSSTASISAQKYPYKQDPYQCDMCEDKAIIYGVRYRCLECDDFDMCEGCFVQLSQNLDVNASVMNFNNKSGLKDVHYDFHNVARIVPSVSRSIKSNAVSVEDMSAHKIALKESEECGILEFHVEDDEEDLFEFYKNLGSSTSVLRELKKRYEEFDDIKGKYDALLAEQKILKNTNNKTRTVFSFTILNDTKDCIIPKSSSLHFRFGKNKEDLTKCYLKLSEKECIQPGSLQILRFNHMFDDYSILKAATYYEIKIMNVDKVLFEATIENQDAGKSNFKELKNELKEECVPKSLRSVK
ncbi:unnamed protein product [Hanseniaspora opuntiae]